MEKKLDINKFIDESLGAKEGHFSYVDIQTYACSQKRDNRQFDTIRDHLSVCQKCKVIFDDIVKCDPFLSQGQPIPIGFWEGFWQRLWRRIN